MSRAMKDSGIPWIGAIPETWNVNMLSSLFDEHKQKNKDLSETNLLSLSYGKIIRKDINTKEGLLPESFDGYNIISDGDIVFRLTDLQNDKRSLRTGLCLEKGIITSAYVTIRARQKLYSPYYHYLVHSYDVCKVFYGMGDGVRQGMNYSDLRKLLLVSPSYSEQQKIAEFLDRKCAEVDEMIALQEQIIEELKAYKQSVITEAVTKGLNPATPMRDSGIEWIGQIPEHWGVCRVKNLSKMISKGATPPTIDEESYEGNVRFIKCENISNNELVNNSLYYISTEINESMKRSQLEENDVLFVIAGATIGKTAIVGKDFLPSNTNQAVSFIRLKDAQKAKFLWYVLQSNVVQVPLWVNAVQSAQPNLSMENLGNFNTPSPIDSEQQAIADYLDEKCADIDSLIQTKQSKIDSLKEYKKSIIYEYVTGKREVEL